MCTKQNTFAISNLILRNEQIAYSFARLQLPCDGNQNVCKYCIYTIAFYSLLLITYGCCLQITFDIWFFLFAFHFEHDQAHYFFLLRKIRSFHWIGINILLKIYKNHINNIVSKAKIYQKKCQRICDYKQTNINISFSFRQMPVIRLIDRSSNKTSRECF